MLTDILVNQSRDLLETQVERWGAEAKRLADTGHMVEALELYQKAADALPGAPWLQLRTAELARKLKRSDVAIMYFRRAADGFSRAGFAKRALPPRRSAWSVAREGLPATQDVFVVISLELAKLQAQLGATTDAEFTIDHANDALRRAGIRHTIVWSESASTAPALTSSPPPASGPQTLPAGPETQPSGHGHSLAEASAAPRTQQ
ncbi:MAG TPA: hypothetical protein VFQ61_26225 [Polyangiaceae bacterium]|nr:hypothetical protein [Polyangiaceae bacterium]